MSIPNAVGFRVDGLLATRVYVDDTEVWALPPTTLTVEGDTFAPMVELAEGSTATVSWVDENDDVVGTGLTPTITWDDEGPHTVRLLPSIPTDVVTLNLGFHSGQDNGLQSLPTSYHWPTQPVTAIANLQNLPGLRRFMAARTNGTSADGSLYTGPLLGGSLNFAGMNTLEYIECFMANVESVTLTGCTSMIRLCVEQCNVAALDLEPVRHSLRDLRAAAQQGGTLTLAALTGPLDQLYHFCTRSQQLNGFPGAVNMPAIRQFWAWRNGLDEDSIVIRSTGPLHTVRLQSGDGIGPNNTVRSLDLAGQTWGGLSGPIHLRASGIGLEQINITGMGSVPALELEDNALNEAMVDHVLSVVEAWGTSGGLLELDGNAAPSSVGAADVDALVARGWTVTAAEPTPGALWEDTFERPDATGWANSGGWFPGPSEADTDVAISGGRLVFSGPSGYRRFLHNAGGSLPADVEVEIGFTTATASAPGTYWGICNRVDVATNTGCRVLFRGNKVTLRIGTVADHVSGTDISIAGTAPAGWNDIGPHTLTLRSVGTTHTVLADGVVVASGGYGGNATFAGGAVGFVGEAQGRAWDYIRVFPAS